MNLQTPRILWLALLMSIPMYVVVGFLAAPKDLTIEPTMSIVLMVVALSEAVASFLLPAHIRRRGYLGAKLPVEEVPDPNAETMFRDSPPMIRQFAESEAALKRLNTLAWTPFIIELAMSEAVAVFGLVMMFLGAEPLMWVPFMALGAILMLVRFPTEPRFVRGLERIYDARMP